MTSGSINQDAPAAHLMLAGAGVIFASICFGIVPYFSRGLSDQGIAPQAIAFFRYVITAVVLLPVLFGNLAAWRELLWGMAAGAAMGLGWSGYAAALKVAPASTVGVLYMTYPVFTVLLSWLIFKDRITRRALIAAGMILLAALIAGNPQVVPAEQLPALVISLAAPAGFGFGICVLVYRLNRIPPLARIACVTLGSVMALAPSMLASDASEVIPQSAHVWLLVTGLALGTALVPQLVYTICSPIVGASRTAVFGSVELPTMLAVSVITLGETLTIHQILGCLLIVAAIVLTQSRRTRNVTTTLTKS